jgi:hypothetical protein
MLMLAGPRNKTGAEKRSKAGGGATSLRTTGPVGVGVDGECGRGGGAVDE